MNNLNVLINIYIIVQCLMDIGWLAQSALAPTKSKDIKVNETYQVGLKIAKAEIQNLKNKGKKQKPKQKIVKRNKGIEQRMKRDQQKDFDSSQKITQKNVYKCLEKKAGVYEKAENKKINISQLLVDFEGKTLNMNKQEQEQYEKDREDFYKGRLAEVVESQKKMHENIQTQNVELSMMRENAAWQIEMLQELKNDEIEQNKPKVQQSFDNKLSKQEKEALDVVLDENEQEKEKLEKIRKRREIYLQTTLKNPRD